MQSLVVAWYNFSGEHEALKRRTSAMAHGIADHIWTVRELLEEVATYAGELRYGIAAVSNL
jgi:hypothetical protein